MQEPEIITLVHRVIDDSPRLTRMEKKIAELESQTQAQGAETCRLGGETKRLRVEMHRMGVEMHRMGDEMHRMGVMMEDQNSRIDKLTDVVLETNRKFDLFAPLPGLVQRLADRQDALEDGFRRHVRNRRVHRSAGR